MRGFRAPVLFLLVAACSSDHTAPGDAPDVPATLSSTSLDHAIALTWSDNSYTFDPTNFQNYRVFSTTYDLDNDVCGSWRLEGTTVAPEFIVGALANGVPRCFAVSAVSVTGAESAQSPVRSDTPRPDARNVVVYPVQDRADSSGFRFWDDDGDGQVEDGELGRIRAGAATDIDFFVDRDGSGSLFFNPVRAGTGVELYDVVPIEDLTSVDVAACIAGAIPGQCAAYTTSPLEASPGFGYVFETDGGDGFLRYGAVRVTHVGQTFLILDWAFQTDRGNPELLVQQRGTSR
ncbi:MAG TPA: hypothetical protein VGQ24_08170 [Gemmatimonadales bacterium]|jgi:hypothetical protein|nr:hypothetical protein [Gemmatimonadales bacterium]